MLTRQFAINAREIHIANSEGSLFDDIILKSTGHKGEHDILVQETNFKFSNGDIKLETGSLQTNTLQDVDGNDGITFGSNTINFHNRTAQNLGLSIGSISASTVASANGFASIDAELDHIETNKLEKGGHTASRLLATSAGGFVVATGITSTLPTTNQTNITTNANNITSNENQINSVDAKADSNFASISTNESNITTNASGISTNTSNISTNTSSISTNTSNITTNTSNITTNSSNITTLDGAVAKTADDETITGDYTFAGELKIKSTASTYTTRLKSTNGGSNNELVLPSTTGTLALYSQFTEVMNSVNANEDSIDAVNANKLNLSGGTLTGKLTISNSSTEQLRIQNSTANGGSKINIFGGTGGGGDAEIYLGESSSYGAGMYYDASTDRFQFYRIDNGAFSNVMYIPYNANSLYIGDIHLGQTNEINIDSGMYLQDDGSGLTADDCFICRNGGTLRVGGTIVPSSDDRLKHNEVDISGAVHIIKQLAPKKYFKSSIPYEANNNFQQDNSGNYIDSSGNVVRGVLESGFIAQEIMDTDLSFLVSGGGVKEKIDTSDNIIEQDLMYGVNYNGLHAYTVKAIQEQQEAIETLQKQLADEEIKTAYFQMQINQIKSHLNI